MKAKNEKKDLRLPEHSKVFRSNINLQGDQRASYYMDYQIRFRNVWGPA